MEVKGREVLQVVCPTEAVHVCNSKAVLEVLKLEKEFVLFI